MDESRVVVQRLDPVELQPELRRALPGLDVDVPQDLDVEARERAAELGLQLDRIESLNDDPAFVRGLAELVRETVSVPST